MALPRAFDFSKGIARAGRKGTLLNRRLFVGVPGTSRVVGASGGWKSELQRSMRNAKHNLCGERELSGREVRWNCMAAAIAS
jgi:hypothetical protein